MKKLNYVILISIVLIVTACNQQNIKTPNEQNPVVAEQANDKTIQQINKEDTVQIENITEEKLMQDKVDLTTEPEVDVIEKSQDESVAILKTDDNANANDENKTDTKITTVNVVEKTVPKIIEQKKQTLTNLTGKVNLNTDAIKYKDVEIKSTVIYFKPNGNYEKPLENKNHIIASQNKRFVPSVLAIQKGSSVTFPNMDRILHNVFSVSNIQKFDLGLYSAGKEKTVTFDNAGIIYVHCNVHHSMQADILVLDTPFYTSVDDNGNFSLEGLPSKSGDLYLWHPRAKLQKFAITESSEINNINKTIDIVRKKIPLHTNKFGAPYRPTRKE